MKNVIVALSLIIAVSASGIGLGDVTGGGEIDTARADELIAKIDEITAKFDDSTARLNAATEAVNAVCAAHGISDILGDPAAAAGIAGDLSDDEKATLTEALESVADVPDILASLGTDIPELMAKIPQVITDLGTQIADNPMKAGDLKDLQSKLTDGQAKMGEIAPAAAETATSANEFSTTVSALL